MAHGSPAVSRRPSFSQEATVPSPSPAPTQPKQGGTAKLLIVEVGQKPNILTRPAGPVKGISGESLSLHCLSEGSPRPRTAWTLPGGSVLERPQLGRKHVLLENGTLVIRDASIHDRGDYVCRAHNDAGESSVTVPVVIVAYAPRITIRPPQAIHTMPGAAVQLHCAALGIPKPEISWELPDHSVLSTDNLGRASGSQLLHPSGTLLIQNPRPSDSGTYKCTAKNHLGTRRIVHKVGSWTELSHGARLIKGKQLCSCF
uniref:Immunoglobulin superfamily member 10 n=1 Tax=Bubo bubo TaxID=30461 RepID=A0A8C0EQN7_BUBBB